MWQVSSGVYLGWSLGSNDAANVFGTAVASRMVRFRTAAILCAVFVLLGSLIQGQEGMHTYQAMSSTQNLNAAFVVALAAALTVTLMTYWSLPVSTSQAVVGGVLGIGLVKGVQTVRLNTLWRILFGWVGTPTISFAVTAALYHMFVLLGLL